MPAPEQESVKQLIATLNVWRRTARAYLCFGRMEKPFVVQTSGEVPPVRAAGSRLFWSPVLTSR